MPDRRADARGGRCAGPKRIAAGYVRNVAERDRADLARTLGISIKRLLGWEPAERHEHFDANGVLTGFTVVTREPEWDDAERDRMLALAVYEAGVCTCGYHVSLTSDLDNTFTFEDRKCNVCAGIKRYGRLQSAQDEQADKELGPSPPPHAARAGDGRHTGVRMLTALEAAERREQLEHRRGQGEPRQA